jgi:transcription elongation factor GreA
VAQKEIVLSPEGLQRLEKELEYLKSVRRREVAERIKQARQFGDLDENSEYEDAKNEQAFVEARIAELENVLRYARVLNREAIDPERVDLGSQVTLRDLDTGEQFTYTIVSSAEADPATGRISDQSPVGRAVLGQKVGAQVEVLAPLGRFRYEIVALGR